MMLDSERQDLEIDKQYLNRFMASPNPFESLEAELRKLENGTRVVLKRPAGHGNLELFKYARDLVFVVAREIGLTVDANTPIDLNYILELGKGCVTLDPRGGYNISQSN